MIIIEDGTGTNPSANSYVTEAELTAYATNRGITLTGTASALLYSAMDFIELQTYKGAKTATTQPLQWPRTGVYVDGVLLASDEVPALVKELQYRVAIDIDQGADPNGVRAQAVKQETVVGAVSVTYQDNSSVSTQSSQVSAILGKLTGGSKWSFGVTRG